MNTENKIVYFGNTNFRNKKVKFGIKTDDRRRHMYAIGKTGMGKSTLLENMIIQDIRMGHGVAYVDPHGDTVEKLLDHIPANRINDVVYFNPSDNDYPIAFNVLESVDDPMKKNLVSSGLIAVFKKLWADSWGPRLEYLLRNAILALLDYPGATLLGVTRMMVDKEFRKKVIAKIQDPVVKAFWVEEYSKYNNNFQVEAISPIQNKVGQFLSMALIRNIVGQVKSSIDIREIMDEKKILLLNLSKGRIGEDASALLGAMMITRMQLAAMSRVDIAENDRNDFYLYVDEFQNFATDSFANILSEARKYRLNLIMAHQYIEQLSDDVRASVFGNVGTLVVFRVGAEDAEFLAKEFAPIFTETDLVNLAKYDMYLKLMIDGVTSDPFSATGIAPEMGAAKEGHRDKIIRVSRERYSSERTVIEDKISRWSGVDEMTIEETKHAKNNEYTKQSAKPVQDNLFHSPCSVCGTDVTTPFEPDGVRPVFCEEHLRAFKEGQLDRSQFTKPAPQKQKSIPTNEPVPTRQNISPKPTPTPQPNIPSQSTTSNNDTVQEKKADPVQTIKKVDKPTAPQVVRSAPQSKPSNTSTTPPPPKKQQVPPKSNSEQQSSIKPKTEKPATEDRALSAAELSLADALSKMPVSFTSGINQEPSPPKKSTPQLRPPVAKKQPTTQSTNNSNQAKQSPEVVAQENETPSISTQNASDENSQGVVKPGSHVTF